MMLNSKNRVYAAVPHRKCKTCPSGSTQACSILYYYISAWTRSYGLLTHGIFVAEIFDCPINLKLYLAEIRVIYTKKHNPIQMTETAF